MTGNGKTPLKPIHETFVDGEDELLKAAADMFGDLVDDLGSPLKALTVSAHLIIETYYFNFFKQSTCTTCLKRLRESFVRSHAHRREKRPAINPEEFVELADDIERALLRFESTSNHALLRLYRRSDISDSESITRASLYSVTGDTNALLLGGDNETVFLVYL
jgi:hypothetical protein